jgi:hypothetical protein
MCWNATTSLITFISGILLSLSISIIAYKQKKWELMVLSLGWIWVIFMQLFEYFIWKNEYNQFFSILAFIFNVTQIFVLGLLFLTLFQYHTLSTKLITIFILLFYMSYLLYYTIQMKITDTKHTKHLYYQWWDQIPFGGFIYLFSLISLFLLVVRPFYWSLSTLFVVLFFLFMSYLFYRESIASMWCFFSIIVPLISFFISLLIY